MICTICARGGSKGVAGKNLASLLGRPLIWWTIDQARQTELFEVIAVSSDSPDILEAARECGADMMITRPDSLATDTAPKLAAIKHALETVLTETGNSGTGPFVDLDVTAPLRLPEDISGAVALQQQTGCTNVITGSPARRSPYFNLVEENPDGTIGLSKRGTDVVRRQDAPRAFDMNASIYVWDMPRFLDQPAVFYEDTRLFEMPEERSIDIDSPLDFQLVSFLMQKRFEAKGEGK